MVNLPGFFHYGISVTMCLADSINYAPLTEYSLKYCIKSMQTFKKYKSICDSCKKYDIGYTMSNDEYYIKFKKKLDNISKKNNNNDDNYEPHLSFTDIHVIHPSSMVCYTLYASEPQIYHYMLLNHLYITDTTNNNNNNKLCYNKYIKFNANK